MTGFQLLVFGIGTKTLFRFFARLGFFGIFLLAALDSSFLFLPFGNDLLLIALISAHPFLSSAIAYTLVTTVGSVLGVLLVDFIMRNAGEKGLEHFVKPKKIKKIKASMDKHAIWAVFAGSLLPPPFPFTAIVMTAAALQFSRKKLLITVFLGRLLRFGVEAFLAVYFGRQVLKVMYSRWVEYFVYGIIVIAIIGSVFSVLKWLTSRKDRRVSSMHATEEQA